MANSYDCNICLKQFDTKQKLAIHQKGRGVQCAYKQIVPSVPSLLDSNGSIRAASPDALDLHASTTSNDPTMPPPPMTPVDESESSESASREQASKLSTQSTSKGSSKGSSSVIQLNHQCIPLPLEKFLYNEAIVGLSEFEPYKPLLENKNYPTVKVWVLQKWGEEMVVKLLDCTEHIRLIHQVFCAKYS